MKLVWKGKLNPQNLSKSNIPPNAIYFYHERFKLGCYIAIIPILLLGIFILFIKSKFIGFIPIFSYPGMYLGIILAVLSLIIHECLHAIAFPSKAVIELFYTIGGIGVQTTYPTTKWRYIFAAFLPSFILGVIPFIIWIFIPSNYATTTLNSAVFVSAWGNLGMSTVDFDTIVHAIIEVPEGAVIQGSEADTFWYIPN